MVEGLAKAYQLRAALHVFVPLSRYFLDPTLLIAELVRDLKASTARLMRKGKVRTDLLLWLLAVGGNSAHAMPERVWFVAHLVNVVRELGIHEWTTMRQSLVKFTLPIPFVTKASIIFGKRYTTSKIRLSELIVYVIRMKFDIASPV